MRDLGISKAGNVHVRALAIERAWSWPRHQPDSALSHWYAERFAAGSSRVRRIGIEQARLAQLARTRAEDFLLRSGQVSAAES
jgi:hypothetical protein